MKKIALVLLGLISVPAFAVVPVDFVYRNEGLRVIVQGKRGVDSLAQACGTLGAKCRCDFFAAERSPRTLRTAAISASVTNNTVACRLDSADGKNFVMVIDSNGRAVTNKLRIKTALRLEDVLGGLDAGKVNKVYKYSCARTFFEGEGVTTSQISCVAGQRLGLISANYDYYLYQNAKGGNLNEKFTASYFPSICGRPDSEFARVSCGNSLPDLRYGFYSEMAGPFNVQVRLNKAPEGTDTTANFGYVSFPDENGECPTGLVQVRPWVAQPASIVGGSIDGWNPPSNFVNTGNGVLNNTVIEEIQPWNFGVTRQRNSTPCMASGSCVEATFDGTTQVQSVPYTPLTPVVCAIPKDLLIGL